MPEKREFDPIYPSSPNPNTIKCKDCVFRDRAFIKIGEKTIHCGVTRIECDIYTNPDWKPHKVLYGDSDCDYYVKDEEYEDQGSESNG